MTSIEFEQLQNIVYYGPVASGDLISKSTRNDLARRGWVTYLPGNNGHGTRDGIRIGGWVATDAGREAYLQASGRTLVGVEWA